MSEKISIVLDTVVKGTEDILSTTSATERLTAAIAEQRNEIKQVNGDLKKVEGYQAAIKSITRTREQYKRATEDVARLSKEQEEHKQHTRGLSVEYKKTEKQIQSLNTELKKASRDGAIKIQNELDAANNRLNSLNHKMAEGKVRTSELNQTYKNATKRVTKLSDKQVSQTDTLRRLGGELKKAGVDTKKLATEQSRLEKQSKEATAAIAKQNEHLQRRKAITDRIESRNAKLSQIGGDATSLAIKAAPIGASVWSAVKNESLFADMKKVINADPEDAARLRSINSLDDWSLRVAASEQGGGLSNSEIKAMMTATFQSGVQDIEQAKKITLDTIKMGVALDLEGGEAGEKLAAVGSSSGWTHDESMEAIAMANTLSNNFNAKGRDIVDVIAAQGSMLKMAGFDKAEGEALTTAILATGAQKDVAKTAVKNISGRLTTGSAATSSQRAGLAKIGYVPEELAKMMQEDASGTLMEVLNSIGQLDSAEQGATVSQIFGEEVKGAASSLIKNTDLFKKALATARLSPEDHMRGFEEEFQTRISSTENNTDKFLNSLNRLSVVFGDALLPTFNNVLDAATVATNWLGDFAKANEKVTTAIALGTAGFITFKSAMLAAKAASLVFGNSIDKGKLFRNGLERETTANGKAAAFAARQIRKMNAAMYDVGSGGRSGNLGSEARKRSKRGRRTRTRSKGLLGKAINLGSSVFTGNRGAIPLSMAGGGLAMMPMVAGAQDAIDIGGDIAQGAGKFGLSKLLRPLSMAISAGNIASALAGGDTKGAIEEGGGLLGGLGGAAAGAALGTAIFPGVGTLVGGLAGSLAGDFFGGSIAGWIGDGLTPGSPNKLMPPEEVEARLAENRKKEAAAKVAPPVKVDAPIQIHAAPGMDAEQIAMEVKRQLEESLHVAGLTVEESLSVSYIDT
ncbi:phage tail tape measure protein [Vibrio sp. Isolate24]|uniref:phage tail tape measure protein n=1 Tax=Vibrio sp. Isolate24 TaxID=2908534 RepID=UPI001EFCB97B|nr:phage tail tape measure protein [Vibrio sp. Isolate24]MCG9678758.1 phage tail tape measure protein [Vibrio sp. Isolate24]